MIDAGLRDVSRETLERLSQFEVLLRHEAARQNLVSASTLNTLWARHIVDSAQLADIALGAGTWLDIGSGAGLPGIVLAIVTRRAVTLVEPRARRVAFLEHCVAELGLDQVEVIGSKIERLAPRPFEAITARAVAALPQLLAMARPFASPTCTYIFPKGASAQNELASAKREWQGSFEIVLSRTSPDSGIVVARNVERRG